ncbi:MAG: phosphoribosylformylglycinamidine synthase subunit PurL [Caldithrix sp.]|nr:MAG: phosphoribosylformylglycinamidine synthase subunit PurL [Caldithrix sp.]
MLEPIVDPILAKEHGLNQEEYEQILRILGRVPTFTELGIFSVMWSEHCSYKNSIAVLKTMPRDGEHLLVKAGEENAGIVDIGGGLAVAFKIESHNHPSAVEPYQGAATGLGGILRDIFSMGARPIAALDSLRFGSLNDARVRYLFNGVVKGIGDYGNCFGVPTVGGEVYFDESYQGNPLVNCMAVGIVKHDRIAKAIAEEPGSAVVIFGSSTGRDGIHGATFASEEIDETAEDRRPQVQVGDPFAEKLLLEATLEMIEADLLVGVQDMGAAGITCSSSEMAAKGECGIELDLDKVPQREPGMTPYEILLSESQERMLAVVKKGNEEAVKAICDKWDLESMIIGKVTSDGCLTVRSKGEIVAEIPAETLVLGGGAPVYFRESCQPDYLDELRTFDLQSLPEPDDYTEVLRKLLSSPNIASKKWVFQQYDHMVRSNTLTLPGSDSAVVRIKGTRKGLALSTDCNGKYVFLNPRRGGQIAVAEAARNVVCSGAQPIAITNCLNFGNPYKPEIFWQFKEAVAGIGEACRALDTPVTGGNVSFYNENPDSAVFPTPVIGMLGLINDIAHVMTSAFERAGDIILLLGENRGEIGGSEYLQLQFDRVAGDCPGLDLEFEKRVQDCVLALIRAGLLSSAHDVSDGGLAVALAESCILSEESLGVHVSLNFEDRADFVLFGEDQSRIVLSLPEFNLNGVNKIISQHNLPAGTIGRVTEKDLVINQLIKCDVAELRELYSAAISKRMQQL